MLLVCSLSAIHKQINSAHTCALSSSGMSPRNASADLKYSLVVLPLLRMLHAVHCCCCAGSLLLHLSKVHSFLVSRCDQHSVLCA